MEVNFSSLSVDALLGVPSSCHPSTDESDGNPNFENLKNMIQEK